MAWLDAQGETRAEVGDQMSKSTAPEDGWFVAVGERQLGPMSASKAWRLVTSIETPLAIQVWHPSLPNWRSLSSPPAASPPTAPAREKLNLDDIRLTNARFITWIACSIAPIFVLGAALARELQDGIVATALVGLVGYLGWWLYLENSGVRLPSSTELTFPHRIALWPFPAFWLRRLRIAEISGFESWSNGRHVYWFKIQAAGRPIQILLDDALHREILILALERRLP